MSRTLVVVVAMLLTLAVRAQPPESPGLVIDVQGRATLAGRGPVVMLAGLAPGAELSLAADARLVVLASASGRQFELHGPGGFRWSGGRIEMLRPGKLVTKEPVASALPDLRLPTARIAQASISMRGKSDGARVRLISPAATWLLAPPAELVWGEVPGASGYRVQLTDSNGKTLHEVRAGATRISLPVGLTLEPGRTYGWQVSVDPALEKDGVREGWAEFGIADAALRERVSRARPAASATFADRVLYAIALEELGVREEAVRVWGVLARERPQDPELAERAQGR